tara:strand:- start:134 stop:769 length:636 start_codon:yes stop_codon:yes gene_type:complete
MNFSEIILNCFSSIAAGFLIYITLIIVRQNWVNTVHYLITFLLLPPITFVITNVISNNLALSLGMIGALSIVRFRNPVKNPLELVVYFGLITLGISFGVSSKFGLLLLLIIEGVLISSKILELIVKKLKFLNLFKYSFSLNDGVLKNFIQVEATSKIDYLDNNPSLIWFSTNNKNSFIYKISVKDRIQIKNIKENISSEKDIVNIEVRYGD